MSSRIFHRRPLLLALAAAPCLTGCCRSSMETIEPAESFVQEGRASWYGKEYAGRPTSSGERFDPTALTAAHPHLPLGTEVWVTYLKTGKSVKVRVTDRGPFSGDRIIDLSEAAAQRIGLKADGIGRVRISTSPPKSAH